MQTNKYYQSKRSALTHSALICLFVYLFICLFSTKAFAEGISLSVSPANLQIEAIPPADARAPFTIENKSDDAVNLKIGYKLFKASEQGDGQVEFLKDNDPFPGADKDIFEKIEVLDNNFSIDSLELGPKQKKELLLRVIAPKKEPYSDYYFSLIFLADSDAMEDNAKPKEKISTATATGGIAINILLSIGPKDNPKGYIEQFSTPWYRESGPVPFSLRIKNAGSHFITPKGMILIKNMFGQTVGKLDISSENILAGTSRYLAGSTNLSHLISESHTSQIVWPETFLLGFYTASLTLAMSDNGPLYTNSIHFFAFPVRLLIGIIIAIIIVIFAYMRIRKKIIEK